MYVYRYIRNIYMNVIDRERGRDTVGSKTGGVSENRKIAGQCWLRQTFEFRRAERRRFTGRFGAVRVTSWLGERKAAGLFK